MKGRAVACASLSILMLALAHVAPATQMPPDPKVTDPATKDTVSAPPASQGPTGADAWTIHLEPEFALENGPVALRVRLVNRTSETRECWMHTHDDTVFVILKQEWVSKVQPNEWAYSVSGRYGPFRKEVEANKSINKLIAIQDGYQRIPPGRASASVNWRVVGTDAGSWQTIKRSWGSTSFYERMEPAVQVRGSSDFVVQRATPENIAQAKLRLGEYIRETVSGTRPLNEIIQCLMGSRQPEFVPLMMRA